MTTLLKEEKIESKGDGVGGGKGYFASANCATKALPGLALLQVSGHVDPSPCSWKLFNTAKPVPGLALLAALCAKSRQENAFIPYFFFLNKIYFIANGILFLCVFTSL